MADFRKLFYALAVVALLASLSAPAFAATRLRCEGSTVVPPIVRSEGYTEMVANILINCTGGVSTTPGQAVPRINVRARLTANITSRVRRTNFDGFFEAGSNFLIPVDSLAGRITSTDKRVF